MCDANRVSFKRIVCPVDLSTDSSEALRYAVALARRYSARLFVLHCTATGADKSVTNRPELERFIEALTRKYSVGATMTALDWESVIVSGEPDVEIAREAAERRAEASKSCLRPHTL